MRKIKRIYPPKRSRKELRLIRRNPYGDKDKDGVMNFFDCKPLDKNWQDVILYHGTSRTVAEKIKKEGLKKDIGINPVVYLTPHKSVAIKYSAGGVVFRVRLPDKVIKDRYGRLTNLPTEVTIPEDISKEKIKEVK